LPVDHAATISPVRFSLSAGAISLVSGLLAAVALLACLASQGFDAPIFLNIFGEDICTTQAASVATDTGEARPGAVAKVVSTEKLAHIPGKNVSVVRVIFPPGGFSPKHYHGGSVTVYVLSGKIRSQLEGAPAAIYGPGEAFFEPFGAIHLFAENMSMTEPAEILAIFVHDEGATLTTYF
jgi:quercetin dioxygenase-like cupin family protein